MAINTVGSGGGWAYGESLPQPKFRHVRGADGALKLQVAHQVITHIGGDYPGKIGPVWEDVPVVDEAELAEEGK